MCSDQSPWAISEDLAYGFGAVSDSNVECCKCYQLTFTTTAIAGKKMIIQATNTGGDVSSAQFDLAVCCFLAGLCLKPNVLLIASGLDSWRRLRTL